MPQTPNNQRLSAAQQRKPEARTSIAADKPCCTEPPVMRWCELFWLKGNWPMARSGVASAPPQTGTILRRPKRPREVQGCSSALRPVRTCPIRLLMLTRTPHGGTLD